MRRIAHRGQALAELAIFGSFLMMGLTLITRYGFQYYFSQQSQQEAFRRALQQAYETRAYDGQPYEVPASTRSQISPMNQGNVTLVNDLHLPDPSNPFVTGVQSPVSGAGRVTWGNDGSEFDVDDYANSTDLPKMTMVVNGKDFSLLPGRFEDVRRYPLTGQFGGPNGPPLICAYHEAYENFRVLFYDINGLKMPKTEADFSTCESTGRPTISNAIDMTIIEFDPNGFPVYRTATTWSAIIVDGCLGDFINPEACKTQCEAIRAVASIGVPVPAYCSSLVPDDQVQGLDTGNFTRDTRTNNSLRRQETASQLGSHTTINEVTTVDRKLRVNPHIVGKLTPANGYPAVKTDPADGSVYFDATSIRQRSREYDWTTKQQ